ncbi:MAG: KpsF/GutQ family sugar-phosphate isomerase [Verrucomicrobia bacterium]|nr:KpsF/GutQ family sugar-phosphate isomerase [Verrucomicrobiota bacterium]
MIKQLFENQQKYVNKFFDSLDLPHVEEFMESLVNFQGVLFFCGVGKSGFVAEKLAMTMVSTGIKSWFIPPTNALHGDIGIVSKGDVFVLLSKSGETNELLELIPYLRNKGARVVAWVSQKGSRLQKAADQTLYLPCEQELCPFGMAPTTSDVIQLIFGNVLAVALMKRRNFSLDEFACNHPAGRIGKRISMRVSDLMLKEESLPLASPQDRLVDKLVELSDKRCGCLLIIDKEEQIAGIFTDGDLRRALQLKGPTALNERLENLMNRSFKSIEPQELAYTAMQLMEKDQKHPIMVLPVVEEGRLKGLLKMHDILQSGL